MPICGDISSRFVNGRYYVKMNEWLVFVWGDIYCFSLGPGDILKKNIKAIINEMKCNEKIIKTIKMNLATKKTD